MDVSRHEALVLRLKRTTGVEAPNLYLRGRAGEAVVPTAPFMEETDAWQEVSIPLERLRSADLSHLDELVLTFEWAEADGALLVDSIRFTSSAGDLGAVAGTQSPPPRGGSGCSASRPSSEPGRGAALVLLAIVIGGVGLRREAGLR